jgi:5-methylcytosine-specific restriction endonuclease McrA
MAPKKKPLSPAEWHRQQAAKRRRRFRSATDQDIHNALRELASRKASLEHDRDVAQRKQQALQEQLLPLVHRLSALQSKRGAIPRMYPKTGWAAFWSPGLSDWGLSRQAELDKEIASLISQIERMSHLPVARLRQSLNGSVLIETKFYVEFEATVRELKHVDAEMTACRAELDEREGRRRKEGRDAAKRAAADRERQGTLEFDRQRRISQTNVKGLRRDHDCPYCGGDLGQEPHADHIIPVAYGGLSVSTNMVYVCAACNLKKGDLTLQEFIQAADLERDAVEQRLRSLGKRL